MAISVIVKSEPSSFFYKISWKIILSDIMFMLSHSHQQLFGSNNRMQDSQNVL